MEALEPRVRYATARTEAVKRIAEAIHRLCTRLENIGYYAASIIMAEAKVIVAGDFKPVLGYEDHEGAPGGEMFAAVACISRSVAVPVTIDTEAGYGMEPAELFAALKSVGAAGCAVRTVAYHRAGELKLADTCQKSPLPIFVTKMAVPSQWN
jgi:Phosphoenolpyruvate phosphomutase